MTLIEKYIQSLPNAEQERIRYLKHDLRLCDFNGSFRFLDMGAGFGTMSAGALLLFENAEGTLVDIQDRFSLPADMSKVVSNRYRFLEWNNLAEINDEKFELVISTDVLEHIPDWRTAFRDLSRYLAPNGYLYIQTPSDYPSPNYPRFDVYKQRALSFIRKNNPNLHVRHGLSCKQLYDEGIRMGLKPLLVAEDYVVDAISHCDFKPRCHCLFQKTEISL